MLGSYKDKYYGVYAYLQVVFNIKDCGELKNYLGIELDRLLDKSIHLRQPYLN